MKITKASGLNLIYWISLLFADVIIYLFLGIMMMGYDDNYTASKGAYMSWESMNNTERIIDSALILWNIINLMAMARLINKIWRWIKTIRAES